MKIYFSEDNIKEGLNRIEIEDDMLELFGEYIEGSGKDYVITGKAIIEGETYHDFKIEFELSVEPESDDIEAVMNMDWEWYDYLC